MYRGNGNQEKKYDRTATGTTHSNLPFSVEYRQQNGTHKVFSLPVFSFGTVCDILFFMNYYALQVKTRSEDTYMKLAKQSMSLQGQEETSLIFPRRTMPIRNAGTIKHVLEPVFPGYIFLEAEELTDTMYWNLRTTPGFYRFLPENKKPKPLEGKDLATLKHFISFGPVADRSKVRFDENDRIQVAEGPLKGLEGKIIKVDKRKGRAKVKLDLYNESFLIDLAFEVIGQQ
jgi:transcriptional antiterminator NusG